MDSGEGVGSDDVEIESVLGARREEEEEEEGGSAGMRPRCSASSATAS